MIKLIEPTIEYKEKVIAYKNDFLANGDNIDGSAGLKETNDIDDWFISLKENASEQTVRIGLVPASTFFVVNNGNELIGMLNIRHRLNDYLMKFGGHIGYSVIKSERRKGYATEILRLGLEECKKLNISEVLLTCDKNNIGSAKVIMKNGGELEKEVDEGDKITQKYWIKLG